MMLELSYCTQSFLVTRSFYWYQNNCPCDLGLRWNWPLSGAFVFHKHILFLDIFHIFTVSVLDVKVEIGNAVLFFLVDISHIFTVRVLDIKVDIVNAVFFFFFFLINPTYSQLEYLILKQKLGMQFYWVFCRYIPVGVLEQLPQKINERPPYYVGRNDLETLMSSPNCGDWVRLR